MLSKIADFARRHRKKLIVGGLVAGGVYVAHQYMKSLEQGREEIRKELLDQIKREHHFEQILGTSDSTILTSLVKLQEVLTKEFDIEELLEKVRTKPENRVELWEEIKIRLISYGIACVYAESLLICALRIQMGIIGGQMLSNHSGRSKQSEEVHNKYVKMIHHYLDKGVIEIARIVKDHVVAAFGHIELKQVVTADDFLLGYNFVKTNVKIISEAPSFLVMDQWVMACSSKDNPLSNSEILNHMVSETRDILQCSDCLAVLENLVSHGFRDLNAMVRRSFAFLGTEKSPLVKVLPALKTETAKRGDTFVKEGLASACSKNFLANVYEAFCNGPKPVSS